MKVVVIRTLFQMRSPWQARLIFLDTPDLRVCRATAADGGTCRRLYREIGREHLWVSRERWSAEDFAAHASRPDLGVWIARLRGEPVGLLEVKRTVEGYGEIALLGVTPAHQGRGIGKHLLSCGIREAWRLGVAEVRVHTRSCDGEGAAANYLRRGFTPLKRRPEIVSLPPSREAEARAYLRRARERGHGPGVLLWTAAHLRESAFCEALRQRVHAFRQRLQCALSPASYATYPIAR